MSRQLRCGVQGLPAAEAALVRTLFKLYQHGTSDFRWALVDTPPYDAVLIDFNARSAGAMAGHEAVKALLTIGDSSLGSVPDTLARPLRSEMLEAWLLQKQRLFFPEGGPGLSVSSPQTSFMAASSPGSRQEAGSYRLLRWPPAAILQKDPSLIRMATVLSRRPINISELARLSQQPLESAYTFLLALRTAGLLDITEQAPSGGRPRPESNAPRSAHSSKKIERSLMSRIRLRLGL